MGFFKKEENKPIGINSQNTPLLPELPDTKSLPELPSLPSLPSMPNTYSDNRADLEEIKSSISPIERRTRELGENDFSIPKFEEKNSINKQVSKAPLFIKIDKFQEAVKKFEEVKNKVSELESSLKKVKEIKEKEEREIIEWENEIRAVKERVSSIDSSIFNTG